MLFPATSLARCSYVRVSSEGCAVVYVYTTKRRSSRACIGNPKPEQESIKGTHAQETPAYQRRPTTLHAAQGSNPPIGALYMQLAKIPHTHLTTPPATRAASADQHGTHRGRNRYQTRWLGMHKQAGTRAGNHQRRTRGADATLHFTLH